MKQLILAFSILALFSCNGSSSSGKKSGGVGDLAAACNAATVEEFFEAMAGNFDLIAVDTFAVIDPLKPNDDDTFTDGEVYTLTYGKDLTLRIETNSASDTLTFGDDDEDFIDFSDNAKYVNIYKNDVRVLTRVDCVEEEPSFFVTVQHNVDVDKDFFWRLDQQEVVEEAAE